MDFFVCILFSILGGVAAPELSIRLRAIFYAQLWFITYTFVRILLSNGWKDVLFGVVEIIIHVFFFL